MVRKLVVVFTSVVLFAAAHAKALGLGEITVESALNQPLAARIELLQLGTVRPDQISVQLASESDFARFSIAREGFLNSIRFNVVQAGNSPYVSLSSIDSVREPYLSFVLETSWPSGRVLSEHTVLLDLPAFTNNNNAPAVSQPEQGLRPGQSGNSSSNQPLTQETSSSAPAQTQRFAAQEPAPISDATAVNGDAVTVEANDTLWNIALEVRPDSSVTVQQTMLALQSLNSEAFIADNINMVRRGQVLRIPNLEQIRALNAREAISEVSRQNQLFDNRRNVPLSSQPVTAQPSQVANAPAGRGELTVVTTDTAEQTNAQSASGGRSAELDEQISDLEDALAVQAEEVDRVTLANDELNERLSLLEQQIASAQEIIRLRDLELAQLQQSLAQAQATEEPSASVPVDPPTVITMAPEKSFLQTLIDTLIANTFILLAATALIILLLVYLLLRRSKAAEEAAFAELGGMPSAGDDATSGVHSEFASVGSNAAVLDDDDELQGILGAVDANGDFDIDQVVEDPEDDATSFIDLDIDSIEEIVQDDEPESSLPAAFAPSERPDQKEEADEANDEIEFIIDEVSEVKQEVKLEVQQDVQQDANLLDFDFAIEGDSAQEVATAEDPELLLASTDDPEHHVDFDFAVLDDEPEVKATPAEIAEELEDLRFIDDSEEIDLDVEFTEDDAAEEEGFDFISVADEVATKLDLAKAYCEMDDQVGAREILEEVLREGSEAQVADAQSLLDKL